MELPFGSACVRLQERRYAPRLFLASTLLLYGCGTVDADDTQKMHVQFDPDFSPYHEHNRRAAQGHGVKYDPRKEQYIDVDGCPTHDRYGQRL